MLLCTKNLWNIEKFGHVFLNFSHLHVLAIYWCVNLTPTQYLINMIYWEKLPIHSQKCVISKKSFTHHTLVLTKDNYSDETKTFLLCWFKPPSPGTQRLTLKRRGYWRTSIGREGPIRSPLWKSMFPFIYICVMHVITLFFYGALDENIFIPIRAHQDDLERRERHPGHVERDKSWWYDINVWYVLQLQFFMANTMTSFLL